MRLLVLSDSHKTMDYMIRAVEAEKPDRILHLGDHITDAHRLAERYPKIPVWCVSGNCDYSASPLVIKEQVEGVRLYMTHGHTLNVKYGLLRAELTAKEEGANVILFGHTHQSLCDWHNGLWMINPGSCSGRGPVTYAVLELEKGTVQAKICSIEKRTEELR